MPKGPQGQKRPADAVGAAIRVARIATGEEEEDCREVRGKAGGEARSKSLTKKRKVEIAKRAALSRWQKDHPDASAETSEHHSSE